MHRSIRQTLLASIIALYGVTALCGPGLHAFVGDEAAVFGSVPQQGDDDDRATAGDHDCPVCHFLAQGQVLGLIVPIPTGDVTSIRPPDQPPLTFPTAQSLPTAPRAPPLA